MKIFKVGGAIRDKLLGLPIHDNDWVVVGATPEDMTDAGFRIVGSDFPVFLHPETQEEFALARTERKVSVGYKGFTVNADPSITLEEDLFRRDLTMNAIAEDEDGNIVDPFNGVDDIKNKVIRHVSPAFQEDPVRILRTARFAARFASINFKVADETMILMRTMVDNGEVDALVPERVWQECTSALGTSSPHVFFSILEQCGALPTLISLVPNTMALQVCTVLTDSTVCRFASLWKDHPVDEVIEMCQALKVPTEFLQLATLVALHGDSCEVADTPELMLNLLESTSAFRQTERFQLFMIACQSSGLDFSLCDNIWKCFKVANNVTNKEVDATKFVGKAFGEELRRLRLTAITQFWDSLKLVFK